MYPNDMSSMQWQVLAKHFAEMSKMTCIWRKTRLLE